MQSAVLRCCSLKAEDVQRSCQRLPATFYMSYLEGTAPLPANTLCLASQASQMYKALLSSRLNSCLTCCHLSKLTAKSRLHWDHWTDGDNNVTSCSADDLDLPLSHPGAKKKPANSVLRWKKTDCSWFFMSVLTLLIHELSEKTSCTWVWWEAGVHL